MRQVHEHAIVADLSRLLAMANGDDTGQGRPAYSRRSCQRQRDKPIWGTGSPKAKPLLRPKATTYTSRILFRLPARQTFEAIHKQLSASCDHNAVRRSRSALPTTLTDDSAIAAAAIAGDSRMPNTG